MVKRTPIRKPPRVSRPLWVCPGCGNRFVNRNRWHSCVRVPVSHHFEGRPALKPLWRAFLAAVRAIGPVRVVSSRSRLALMTRVRFAGVSPRRDHLRGALWLTRPVRSPRFVRVELVPPDNYLHYFELRSAADLDDELRSWLREAYRVGRQEHLTDAALRTRGTKPPAWVRVLK